LQGLHGRAGATVVRQQRVSARLADGELREALRVRPLRPGPAARARRRARVPGLEQQAVEEVGHEAVAGEEDGLVRVRHAQLEDLDQAGLSVILHTKYTKPE
jgi:hypothetical protein